MKNDIIRIGHYRLRTIHVHYFTWFQKTYPIEYGVRIYQYETPTNYRQIVKIK